MLPSLFLGPSWEAPMTLHFIIIVAYHIVLRMNKTYGMIVA